MQITTILAFITAMGGLEAVKWLVRYITCRKTGGLAGRTADST